MTTAIDQAVQAQDPTLAYWQARRTMASLPALWESPHRLVYAFAHDEEQGAVTFACARDFSCCTAVRFHLVARLLADGVEYALHEGVIGRLPSEKARRPGNRAANVEMDAHGTDDEKKPAP